MTMTMTRPEDDSSVEVRGLDSCCGVAVAAQSLLGIFLMR